MRRELQTVQEEDSLSLAEAMMRWEGLRYVPVENEDGELVGLVSLGDLVEAMRSGKSGRNVRIGEIMSRDVVTVDPEMRTLDVIDLMRNRRLACVPVVREGTKLVGMVCESDFLTVAARLLE